MTMDNKFDLGDEVYYLDDLTNRVKKGIVQDIEFLVGNDMGVRYSEVRYNFLEDEYNWIIESRVFNNKQDADNKYTQLNAMYYMSW